MKALAGEVEWQLQGAAHPLLPRNEDAVYVLLRNTRLQMKAGDRENIWHCGKGWGAAAESEHKTSSVDTNIGASGLQGFFVVVAVGFVALFYF